MLTPIPDLINGSFELVGGCMGWLNVRALARDKTVRGVRILPSVLFASWGFWNLYYYPSLHQWASFTGGLAIGLANTVWVYLAIKYSTRRP